MCSGTLDWINPQLLHSPLPPTDCTHSISIDGVWTGVKLQQNIDFLITNNHQATSGETMKDQQVKLSHSCRRTDTQAEQSPIIECVLKSSGLHLVLKSGHVSAKSAVFMTHRYQISLSTGSKSNHQRNQTMVSESVIRSKVNTIRWGAAAQADVRGNPCSCLAPHRLLMPPISELLRGSRECRMKWAPTQGIRIKYHI